jgi:non-heme chloroperoxidase
MVNTGHMKTDVKSVELPGGLMLSYAEQGDRPGIPVVLLHGVTDSWRSFEPVLPYLPVSLHAFALSQRGHGDSGRPASYHTHDFARDVVEFMDALGISRAVVVGHSMGSTNAMRLAIEAPGRVMGLVLVGAFASYRANGGLTEFWQSSVSHLTDPISPSFVREFQESTLAQSVSETFFQTVVEESLKPPARVWRASFDGFFEDACVGELDRIRAPTLLVWGTHDSLPTRKDQDELLAAIPDSRLIVYEDAGHALHWEEPERFARDLVAFVQAVRD